MLEAIKFNKSTKTLHILDQLVIPFQERYLEVNSISDGYAVIKKMQVRGAPAIAIVGSFSVVVELNHLVNGTTEQYFYDLKNVENFKSTLLKRFEYLNSSRPTAVNLSNALREISRIVESATSIKQLFEQVLEFSVKLYDDDLANNLKIGFNGASYILKKLEDEKFSGPFSVITICNTGSLATSGHGTALGVIRSLWELSKSLEDSSGDVHVNKKQKTSEKPHLAHVFPLETRPYNQGSRLTAFELCYEKIPSTLITDSMVTYLLDVIKKGKKDFPPVKFVIVGADRIVKNGDTANKIGTFQLANIVSKEPEIEFLVAAPKTTIDSKTETGDEILVEERPSGELKIVTGGRVSEDGKVKIEQVQVAPPEMAVWNPSFDVTPHSLIDGIVTEQEVLVKKDGAFCVN